MSDRLKYVPQEIKIATLAAGSLLLALTTSGCEKKASSTVADSSITPVATATSPQATPTKEVPTATPLTNAVLVMNGDCQNTRLLSLGARYINNPEVVNNDRLAGPSDIAIGESPKFGQIVVVRKNNPNDPISPEFVIARPPLVVHNEVSSVLIDLYANSNTSGKTGKALAIEYYFEEDKKELDRALDIMRQPRYKTTVTCGATKPVMGGRIANPEEVMKALKQVDYRFKTLGAIMEEAMIKATGKTAGFPNPDNYSNNRRAVGKYAEALNLPKQ